MSHLSAPSRRAPLLAALATLGTGAETRRRRNKKKKPPPPLAVVTIAIQDVTVHQNMTHFVWGYDGQVRHVSGKMVDLTDTIATMPLGTTQDETLAALRVGARSLARTLLLDRGEDVPEDRIAAVLL